MNLNLLFTQDIKDKKIVYEKILPPIYSLWKQEKNIIANLANTTAVLKETFGHWWIGFYILYEKKMNSFLVLSKEL